MLNSCSPIQRMKTERTVLEEDASFEACTFTCREKDEHPFLPFEKTNYYPPYTTMVEEMTPNSSRDRKMKPFEHYKAFRSPFRSQGIAVVRSFGDFYPHLASTIATNPLAGIWGELPGEQVLPYGNPGLPLQGLPAFYEKRVDGGFVPPPGILSDLLARATRSILPVCKEELSVINSAIELRDFKSLPRTIARIRALPARMRLSNLRQFFHATADGYLQLQFNMFPLLSDISGIRTALTRTEARMNDLLTRAGTPQKRHFTFSWYEFPPFEPDESDKYYIHSLATSPDQWNLAYLTRTVDYSSTVFHAMIEYNFNYTQYQREHARVLSLLDAFGVNLNPRILWNAVKWSFVVDWVLNVGSWLDQFKYANMEPQINIRQCCWSVKRRREVDTRKHNSNVYPHAPVVTDPNSSLPRTTETAYRRDLWTPTASWIKSSGLDLKEVSLAAALVLPRRRNRNQH